MSAIVFDDFERSGDVVGSTPNVGGSWTSAGVASPTMAGGVATSVAPSASSTARNTLSATTLPIYFNSDVFVPSDAGSDPSERAFLRVVQDLADSLNLSITVTVAAVSGNIHARISGYASSSFFDSGYVDTGVAVGNTVAIGAVIESSSVTLTADSGTIYNNASVAVPSVPSGARCSLEIARDGAGESITIDNFYVGTSAYAPPGPTETPVFWQSFVGSREVP